MKFLTVIAPILMSLLVSCSKMKESSTVLDSVSDGSTALVDTLNSQIKDPLAPTDTVKAAQCTQAGVSAGTSYYFPITACQTANPGSSCSIIVATISGVSWTCYRKVVVAAPANLVVATTSTGTAITTYDYGSFIKGSSESRTFYLKNTGGTASGACTFSFSPPTGTVLSDYSASGCSSGASAGSSCPITLALNTANESLGAKIVPMTITCGAGAAVKTANLVINYNLTAQPVALGLQVSAPGNFTSITSYDFGSISTSSPMAPVNFILKNAGTVTTNACTFSFPSLATGAISTYSSGITTCNSGVDAGGGTCSFTVSIATSNQTLGAKQFPLSISCGSAASQKVTLNLSYTLTGTPANIGFSTYAYGGNSSIFQMNFVTPLHPTITSQTLYLNNLGGTPTSSACTFTFSSTPSEPKSVVNLSDLQIEPGTNTCVGVAGATSNCSFKIKVTNSSTIMWGKEFDLKVSCGTAANEKATIKINYSYTSD